MTGGLSALTSARYDQTNSGKITTLIENLKLLADLNSFVAALYVHQFTQPKTKKFRNKVCIIKCLSWANARCIFWCPQCAWGRLYNEWAINEWKDCPYTPRSSPKLDRSALSSSSSTGEKAVRTHRGLRKVWWKKCVRTNEVHTKEGLVHTKEGLVHTIESLVHTEERLVHTKEGLVHTTPDQGARWGWLGEKLRDLHCILSIEDVSNWHQLSSDDEIGMI